MNIHQILDRIEYATGEYELEAVTAAILHGARIVPCLIEMLETAADRNTKFLKDTAYTGHLYSIHILTELREPEAHIPLLQFCTVPPRLVETIFGDEFLETHLEHALAATANGDTSGLMRLIEDFEVHGDIRHAAIEALVRMATFGDIEHKHAVDCLSELFTHLERKPSPVWEHLAQAARSLAAKDIRSEVREIWKAGLIVGDWKEISADLTRDWETQRPELQKYYELDEPGEREDWWSADSRRLATAGFCEAFNEDVEDELEEDEEMEEEETSQALPDGTNWR